jgi:hypothetical protein
MTTYYKEFLDEGVEYTKLDESLVYSVYIESYGSIYAIRVDKLNKKYPNGEQKICSKEKFDEAVKVIDGLCRRLQE